MVAMASLQMMKFTTNMSYYFPSSLKFKELNSCFFVEGKGVKGKGIATRKRVFCKLQDGDDLPSKSSNNEPPESLFMKELQRRGITPTSLLEESNRTTVEEEIVEDGVGGGFSKRNAVATDSDKSLTNQREQSMALNSEGLEGLIPRAKLLLRLGGTFFLSFWPLIIMTVGSFAALYLYFGPTFIHDGTNTASLPQYIDPYKLLEDERIIQ